MLIRPRRPKTAEWIRGILAAQIALAGWLVVSDLSDALPRVLDPRAAPPLTRPIEPGDQTRRYEPARLPALPPGPGLRALPDRGDMPPRLRFEPTGERTALARGDIAEGDAARFEDWLATLPEPPERLDLHSSGGAVGDALAIGRRLRELGVQTRVAAGAVCLSACPYVLAGGVLRQVEEGAHVGVHQHYFGENVALPAFLAVRDIQAGQAQVVAYLAEMGIDLRLMQPALATPPEDIYVLTPQELERYRLTTPDGPPP